MVRTQIILFYLLATILLHRLVVSISSQDDDTKITERLQFVNKATIKSFLTKYGDIIDCVEINKQLSLDHPLLKNHSIQIKPNFKESNQTLQNNRQSKVVAERMRCPIGSVPIKRVQKEDLQMQKFSSLAGIKFSKCSNSICTNTGFPEGHQYATLISNGKNLGVSGSINVWSPEVGVDQLSDASVYVAADDGPLINGLASGWAVYPNLFQNSSRLYAYWTRDSGHSTGCFNLICPGFVQVSPKVYLGLLLQPISTYGGSQYFITISIKQDLNTKNWWLFYGDEGVGYWPKELLTTLSDGATRAGWGGEIYSPPAEAAPPMGSGHFPEEGPNKAAVIYGLNLFGSESPNKTDLKVGLSKPDCYKVIDGGDKGGQFGHYMFFGGPPNCKL